MTVYVAEDFEPDEADILRRYFTNLDGPVFALVNLPEVVKGALFARYSRSAKSLRRLFLDDFVGDRFPKDPADTDFVYRQAVRAKAFDALRGILPAASLSNVGIYGTGQGYEQLLLRMRSHPLPEARAYADLMLTELRKVIPSFLKRVDLDDRGVAWSTYLATNQSAMEDIAAEFFPPDTVAPERAVTLVDFD